MPLTLYTAQEYAAHHNGELDLEQLNRELAAFQPVCWVDGGAFYTWGVLQWASRALLQHNEAWRRLTGQAP